MAAEETACSGPSSNTDLAISALRLKVPSSRRNCVRTAVKDTRLLAGKPNLRRSWTRFFQARGLDVGPRITRYNSMIRMIHLMLSLRNTALYIFEDVKVSVATEYFFDRLIFFFKKVVKGD